MELDIAFTPDAKPIAKQAGITGKTLQLPGLGAVHTNDWISLRSTTGETVEFIVVRRTFHQEPPANRMTLTLGLPPHQ